MEVGGWRLKVKFILNLSAMKSQMVGHVTFVSSYIVTDTFQNIYKFLRENEVQVCSLSVF